jgi:hypothetical protein
MRELKSLYRKAVVETQWWVAEHPWIPHVILIIIVVILMFVPDGGF